MISIPRPRGVQQGQWAYVGGVLALPVITVFIISATFMASDYTHTRDTISQLGAQGRPKAWVANTGIFLYGLFVLIFAYGLARRFGDSPGGKVVALLVGLNAAGALFAAVFQAAWGEAEIEPSVLGDSIHQLAARTGFMTLTSAMLMFPALVWRNPEWRPFTWILLGTAIVSMIVGLLFVFNAYPVHSGILQRCYFATCGLWLEIVALRLIATSNTRAESLTDGANATTTITRSSSVRPANPKSNCFICQERLLLSRARGEGSRPSGFSASR